MYAHDVCHEYVLRGHDENDSYQHDDESNHNGDEPQRREAGHDERSGHDTNARCDENRGAVGRGLPAHSSMRAFTSRRSRAFTSRRSRVGTWWLLSHQREQALLRARLLALQGDFTLNTVVVLRSGEACADFG